MEIERSRTIRVQMPGPGDEDLDLIMWSETVFEREGEGEGGGGFREVPCLYPVTIVQSRYSGTYEGGLEAADWLAFPVGPHELTWASSSGISPWAGWDASDLECAAWWREAAARGIPVGRGATPDGALRSLLECVAAAAGVTLDELSW